MVFWVRSTMFETMSACCEIYDGCSLKRNSYNKKYFTNVILVSTNYTIRIIKNVNGKKRQTNNYHNQVK